LTEHLFVPTTEPWKSSGITIKLLQTLIRLIIRHDASSEATPYITGTLLFIRKVKGHIWLIRGLDKIMD
jgi:hypothetical protein